MVLVSCKGTNFQEKARLVSIENGKSATDGVPVAARPYRILTLASGLPQEASLTRYGEALARARGAETRVLTASAESWANEARKLSQSWPFQMLLAGWYRGVDKMRMLAQLSEYLNVDTTIVKDWSSEEIRRVLITTSGGPNALETIRVGHEIAVEWGKPDHVLRIVRGAEDLSGNLPLLRRYLRQIRGLTRMQIRLMGLDLPLTLRASKNVVAEIVRRTRPGDLIVMGGPKDWRIEQHLIGSIPGEIALNSGRPALMVISRKRKGLELREVFWEESVRMNFDPKDKWEAIRTLVDTLVEENQLPVSLRERVIETAFQRERTIPTASGNETAIPHAAIPYFRGLVGSLGICPKGVQFDERNVRPARFIFFLLTPKESYSEYLVVLSKVAHLMHDPAARESLLKCRTPAEVIAILGSWESVGSGANGLAVNTLGVNGLNGSS